MAKKDEQDATEPIEKPVDKPTPGGIVAPPGATITMKPGGAHNQIKLPEPPKMAAKTPLQRPSRETQAP